MDQQSEPADQRRNGDWRREQETIFVNRRIGERRAAASRVASFVRAVAGRLFRYGKQRKKIM